MYARLNSEGRLEVMRKNMWVMQECPYGVIVFCGHKCPMFYEDGDGYITICSGSKFHIIEDYR